MKYLKAEAAQLTELCALYQAVSDRPETYPNDWQWGVYPTEDMIRTAVEEDRVRVLTDDEGRVTAVCCFQWSNPEVMGINWLFGGRESWIRCMAVSPECQKQGLAAQLFRSAAEELKAAGAANVRVAAGDQNPAALALWSSLGMRFAGKAEIGGISFRIFEKQLDGHAPLLPLLMRPAFRCGKATPWGGDVLVKRYGKAFPEVPAGESLECSCIPGLNSTDVTGVELHTLIENYGVRMAGRYAEETFPLLLKLLDAADNLSVQVHPDDAYAGRVENGKLGKTEAWLILEAVEGAELVYGLTPGVDLDTLRKACEDGPAVQQYLRRVKVVPGDVCFIPAGCIHAIGPGIQLYEIQQSSDVTYRFYDWDRRDAQGNTRELHIGKALDVSDLNFTLDPVKAPDNGRVLDNDCFTLDIVTSEGKRPLPAVTDFAFVTALENHTQLCWEGGFLMLNKGETCYVPAAAPALTLMGFGKAAVSMPAAKK